MIMTTMKVRIRAVIIMSTTIDGDNDNNSNGKNGDDLDNDDNDDDLNNNDEHYP